MFEPRAMPGFGAFADIASRHDDIFALACGDGRIELRHGGMTFDVVPAADAAGFENIGFSHRASIAQTMEAVPQSSLLLVPGPHVAAGAKTIPVLREWLSLAARLAGALHQVCAIGWTPANLLMHPDYFCRHVAGWLSGGMFPSPVLGVFVSSLGNALQSEGAAFFAGQELRLEGDFGADDETRDRIAQRLFAHLAYHGALDAPDEVSLPDGRTVRLEPSANHRFVRALIA